MRKTIFRLFLLLTINNLTTNILYSEELVTNGDFSAGNTGFTTSYTYNQSSIMNAGYYTVTSDVHNQHPSFTGLDHTTPGSGKFMAINGDIASGISVWKQTIHITPNTTYYFSAWVLKLCTGDAANLQFSINGSALGTPFSVTSTNWQQFYISWNSGSTTSATIMIVDLQTSASGNDFGIDDISFTTNAPASITIPAPSLTVTQPTCGTTTGTISITSPLPPTGTDYFYSINGGTSSQNSPVFSNLSPGTYSVIAYVNGVATPAVSTIVNALPTTPAAPVVTTTSPAACGTTGSITVTSPTGTDITYSIDGATYQPSATFTNVPAGTYAVTAKNGTSCASPANTVTITAPLTNIIIADKSIATCSGLIFSIIPKNGTDVVPDGTTYSWSAPSGNGFTGGSAANGTANVSGTLINTGSSAATATYTVTPTVGGCNGNNFKLIVTINAPPAISGATSVCKGSTSQLMASIPAGTTWINYDPAIASLDSTGLMTGLSEGLTYITFTNNDNCRTKIPVTVNALPSITITTPATCAANLLTYSVGVSTSIGSSLTSTAGTVTNTGSTSWTVSNIPAGTNIILTAINTSLCSATLPVTAPDCSCPAVNAPVSGGDKTFCTGSPIPALTASVNPGETVDWYAAPAGSTSLATNSLTYTPSVGGIYYAEARNTSSNCKSAIRTAISVSARALPTITTAWTSLCKGTHFGMQGSGTAAATAPWVSSNPTIANMDNNGIITGISAGTSNITYTDNYGCQASVTMTVNELPSISGSFKACAGSTTQLTGSAIAASSNAWMSLYPTIATVDNTGLVTGLSSGIATIMYTNSNGCFIKAEIAIGSATTITAEPIPTQTVCQNTTPSALIVSANGTNLQYQWYANTVNSTGSGTAISGATLPKYTPPSATAGTVYYYCVVKGDCAAVTSTISTITVNATPAAPTAPVDATICDAGTATISATVSTGETIDWYASPMGGTNIASGTSFTTPTLNTSTTYYAEGRNIASGCISTSRITANATVYSTAITNHQDAARCGNGSVTLTATGAGTIHWYATFTGGTSLATGNSFTTPVISATTTYYADATVGNCTTASRTAVVGTINEVPDTPMVETTQPNCVIPKGTIEITNPATGTSYSIDHSDFTNVTGIFTNVATGSYPVTAKNIAGCLSADTTVEIISPTFSLPKSDFSISTYSIDTKHNTVTGKIHPETNITYSWDFGDGNSDTGPAFDHTYQISGKEGKLTVTLTATDSIGCNSSTVQVLTVSPFIPNVFTPNNDGYNDLFMPGFDLLVFDRNGLHLYDGDKGWNGTYKGTKVDPDTYFYLVRYTDTNSVQHIKKGYVVLTR